MLRDEDGLEVWVEVKDWAGESGDQLETYKRLRQSSDGDSLPVLVYLARHGTGTPSVPDFLSCRWQDFAEALRRWSSDNALKPAERWLFEDYLTYLRERGLVMSDPFPSDAREVVAKQWKLWDTLEQLHIMIKERLEHSGSEPITDHWGAQRKGGSIDVWPGQWWSLYRPRPTGSYPSCDFEVTITGLTPEDHDSEPRFNAELVWRSERELSNPIADQDWARAAVGISFDDKVRFELADEQSKFRRSRAIADVPGATLADQAGAMAEFAETTFGALRDHPPASVTYPDA